MLSKGMDSEEGSETGYVSDSSLTSRQGTKQKRGRRDDRAYINRRKTKSERNKRRSSRASSQFDSLNGSESENSNGSMPNHPKYRRRSGSKRNEYGNIEQRKGPTRNSFPFSHFNGNEEDGIKVDIDLPLHPYRSPETKSFLFLSADNVNQIIKLKEGSDVSFSQKLSTNHNVIDKKPPVLKSSNLRCSVLQSCRISGSPNSTNQSLDNDNVKVSPSKFEHDTVHLERSPLRSYASKQSKHILPNDTTSTSHRSQSAGSESNKSYHARFSKVQKAADNTVEKRTKNIDVALKLENRNSTATLKMNMKDINCDTWDPTEQAVFSQMMKNLNTKSNGKNNLINKLRVKCSKKESTLLPNEQGNQETVIYPLSEYVKPNERRHKKSLSGLFSGFKWFKDVLKRPDKSSKELYIYPREQPLIDYPQPKKKNIFKRLRREKDAHLCRRRAQSTNSHYSVDRLLDADASSINGSFATVSSIRTLFKRTKSADNLNGAFEYFANQKQVFQRTTSVTKNLKGCNASRDCLDDDMNTNQPSPSHVFQPILVESDTAGSMMHNHNDLYRKGNHATLSEGFNSHQYDSAYEEENRYYHSKNESSTFLSTPSSHPGFSFMVADDESGKTAPFATRQHLGSFNLSSCKEATTFTSCASSPSRANGNIPVAQMSMIPHHARRAIQRSMSKVNADLRRNSRSSAKGRHSEKVL